MAGEKKMHTQHTQNDVCFADSSPQAVTVA